MSRRDHTLHGWKAVADIDESAVPQRTLRRWCAEGKVKAKKAGKNWFVREDSLAEYCSLKTISDICAATIPKRTLRRWCAEGKVEAKKIGKNWVVDLESMLGQRKSA